MGVLLGGRSTRIPELKTALHMNDATLGRTLIGSSLAAIFISRVMGKLINLLGTKKVFYLGSLGISNWIPPNRICTEPILCISRHFRFRHGIFLLRQSTDYRDSKTRGRSRA
jgi:hypothetical protein